MKEEYVTKNLQIAAYLYASNIHFIGANKVDKSYYFKFEPKDKAEELINKYFSGQASVNPKELFSKLNDLKDLIFS